MPYHASLRKMWFLKRLHSKLILYTSADIKREEADDQVLQFLAFWKEIHPRSFPTMVFDSKFTTYNNLTELDIKGVKFITLRRRGKNLLEQAKNLGPWKRVHIPHAKRKYANPQIHDSLITLRGYDGQIRQIVMRDNGHEQPAFLITNDFESPVELVISNSPLAGGKRNRRGGEVLPSQCPVLADPDQGATRCDCDHDRRLTPSTGCWPKNFGASRIATPRSSTAISSAAAAPSRWTTTKSQSPIRSVRTTRFSGRFHGIICLRRFPDVRGQN